MTQELPSTESPTVTRMAIAWNMVIEAGFAHVGPNSDQNLDGMIAAYIKTYNAILENEHGG